MHYRRYLFYRLNLLEGLLGFGLSGFGTLKSRCKLRLSSLQVTLQALMFFHEILELLLYLRHPCLLLLSLGALRGRSLLGLGQRLLEVTTSVVAPTIAMLVLSSFCNCVLFYIYTYL